MFSKRQRQYGLSRSKECVLDEQLYRKANRTIGLFFISMIVIALCDSLFHG